MADLSDVMNKNLVCVKKGISIAEGAQLMTKMKIGALVVGSAEKIEGIFTERDVLNRVVAKGLDPAKSKIEQVMSSPVEHVGVELRPEDALELMDGKGFRHLPVVDSSGKTLGMLSIRDLFHFVVERQRDENETLVQFLSADGPGG